MLSSTKDRAYRLRYNRNQIRVDNCFEASVQLGFLGGFIVSRGWHGRKFNMNCMGNGYEMNGWMRKKYEATTEKKYHKLKVRHFLGKKNLAGHWMEGSKKLGAWWYGYIVPLTPREWCGANPPRVWITFLGWKEGLGPRGGRLRKFWKGGSEPENDDLEDPLEGGVLLRFHVGWFLWHIFKYTLGIWYILKTIIFGIYVRCHGRNNFLGGSNDA